MDPSSEESYDDWLAYAKAQLKKMGDVYDPEPADVHAPLDEKLVVNDFYRALMNKSPEEKKKIFTTIFKLNFGEKGHYVRRYHIAGAVAVGADPDTIPDEGIPITLLQEAAIYNDDGLCQFLLDHRADPNKNGRFGPALFLCNTVKLARLLLDKGADPKVCNQVFYNQTVLHQAARCQNYEPGLIGLYKSAGVSVFSEDSSGGTLLHSLAFGVEKHTETDIKNKLDALFNGLSTCQKLSLSVMNHKNWGTASQIIDAQSQQDKKTFGANDRIFIENEQKRNYFKTLLHGHLSGN